MRKKIVVIGSGFSSLSASCYLAKQGFEVTVLEKNEHIGGRAQQYKTEGFTFDMGPTFYWMPDVFESFFNDFNKTVPEYYDLNKLNPAYQVYFGKEDSISIPDNFEDIVKVFESIETGSSEGLQKFIAKAEVNYDIAIKDLVYQPGESIIEIITSKTILKLGDFVNNIKNQVAKHIKNEKLRKILEFPVLFLGAKSSNTPSFYNFMNYADFKLGTWHPKGGMFAVVEAMKSLAVELGVSFVTNASVSKINVEKGIVKSIESNGKEILCDIVLSGADYHHTEQLLPESYRQYSPKYWDRKTFAPSALLFYVGFNKKLENLAHHTLFFDTDFNKHAEAIYDTKIWPEKPLFYASFPSMTDDSVAPSNHEAGIFLIPLAPDLKDTEELREKYFNILIDRLEYNTGQNIRASIKFEKSFGIQDFKDTYNSYKGNAYGLANTLRQTHILRPKLKSKKIKNMYFTGQLTVPGPGVPPSIISGKIVSALIHKYHN